MAPGAEYSCTSMARDKLSEAIFYERFLKGSCRLLRSLTRRPQWEEKNENEEQRQ